MIKRFLTVLFLLNTVNVFCQPTWQLIPKIERNAYEVLDGSIDNKYPISLYFEFSFGFCGSNDNNRWNPRIIKGWYEYKKFEKRIPLIGSMNGNDGAEYFMKLFVPKDLLDTLDGKTCVIHDFKEMFFIQNGPTMDTMYWKKSSEGIFHKVTLKEIHPYSWETKCILSFEVSGINLLDINLSELANNKFIDKVEVEAANQVDDKFYIIFRFGHSSNPGGSGSGYCGAGWEGLASIHTNQQFTEDREIRILPG
jgi:hypothetical protein